jgi:hypothetical protein
MRQKVSFIIISIFSQLTYFSNKLIERKRQKTQQMNCKQLATVLVLRKRRQQIKRILIDLKVHQLESHRKRLLWDQLRAHVVLLL